MTDDASGTAAEREALAERIRSESKAVDADPADRAEKQLILNAMAALLPDDSPFRD